MSSMTGTEIIEALKSNKHVNIQSSTERWIHATSFNPDGEDYYTLSGYNNYNDDKVLSCKTTDTYVAYIPDCACNTSPHIDDGYESPRQLQPHREPIKRTPRPLK